MECALCTEVHTHYGLTKCGHRSICSLCWYRMRSLLDLKSCPLCRQNIEYLFITSSPSLQYDSIVSTGWNDSFKGFTLDIQSQIYFEDQSELQRLLNFKQLSCKFCTLEIKNLAHFKDHLLRFHNKKICEVCLKHNNLFPSEQELYEDLQLNIHKINHHSQCDLCFDYYYSQRHLLEHIKNQHFFCELCDVVKRTAFSNYADLEVHYRQEHFLCEVGICREEMHVVFMCYDDLRDHYKSNHFGIPVPVPVCAFKVRNHEESPEMVFEENYAKNYSVPVITAENKDFEFPALGGPSSTAEEKKTIDYSKISKKKPKKPKPEIFSSTFFPPTPESKPEPFLKTSKKVQKQELSPLEKNIARLNNGHMTIEEFINQLPEKDRENLSSTITTIRKLVLSNTNKEKLVQELERPQKRREKPNFYSETQESKQLPKEEAKKITATAKKSQPLLSEHFPALGDAKAPKVKSEFSTLLENIVIFNNKLITAQYFVDSLLEFMPRTEVTLYRKTIKEKIRPEARANEVLNLFDHVILMTANESEYPSLVSKKEIKPALKKNDFPSMSSANVNNVKVVQSDKEYPSLVSSKDEYPSLIPPNDKDYPPLGKSSGQSNKNFAFNVQKKGIPMKNFFINK